MTVSPAVPEHGEGMSPPGSLGARIRSAASWSMGGLVISQVIRFGGNLIITRLLVPEMFGIIAIVSMVQMILNLFADIGLRQSIIQSPRGTSRVMLDTAWTLQVVRGAGIWATCLLIAVGVQLASSIDLWPKGSTYAAPELPLILAVASFGSVISGFSSTKLWVTDRQLDVKWSVAIDVMVQIITLAIMLTIAWFTRSIWSIIISGLVATLLQTVASHMLVPGTRNTLCWDREAAASLLKFGVWILASSVLFVCSATVDKLMLGWWVTPAVLGVYSIALSLVSTFEMLVLRIFNAVSLSALSEIGRTDRSGFRSKFFRLRLPFDVLLIMGAGGLFSSGSAIAHLLFDNRYAQVGNMLEILSLSVFSSRISLVGQAYMALGQSSYLMWTSAIKLVAAIALIPASFHLFGLDGALYAIALHGIAMLPVTIYLNSKHDLNDFKYDFLPYLAWLPGYGMGLVLARLLS